MKARLNARTQRIVDLLFSINDREAASRLLLEMEEPVVWTSFIGTDTAQLAALKVSHGDLERLRKALEVGHVDGRDLAGAAGFLGPFSAPIDEKAKSWAPKPGRGSWRERFRESRHGIR